MVALKLLACLVFGWWLGGLDLPPWAAAVLIVTGAAAIEVLVP